MHALPASMNVCHILNPISLSSSADLHTSVAHALEGTLNLGCTNKCFCVSVCCIAPPLIEIDKLGHCMLLNFKTPTRKHKFSAATSVRNASFLFFAFYIHAFNLCLFQNVFNYYKQFNFVKFSLCFISISIGCTFEPR